jgi:hypothetical protein
MVNSRPALKNNISCIYNKVYVDCFGIVDFSLHNHLDDGYCSTLPCRWHDCGRNGRCHRSFSSLPPFALSSNNSIQASAS